MILTMDLGEKSYPIQIEKGCLSQAATTILPHLKGNKVAILTDTNVDGHYGDLVLHSFLEQGIQVFKIVLPPGESSKSIEMAMKVYNRLAEEGFSRKDLLITLGGGVIGDLGGYCAATWQRGVDFYQIPTSLLAQVDSSIGGKVAIDLPYGKNLVGAFHQPKGVLIDPDTLKTLEEKYFIDGMAEVIKYGAIFDAAFFQTLEEEAFTLEKVQHGQSMDQVLYQCCQFKKAVVEEDEREQGRRALLNFGHTLGHGLEKVQAYQGYSHGEAVAIGMCLIAAAGESLGWTASGTYERLLKLCKATGLPTVFPVALKEEVLLAMEADKKAQGSSIKLILLKEIGQSYIVEVEKKQLSDILARGIAYGNR